MSKKSVLPILDEMDEMLKDLTHDVSKGGRMLTDGEHTYLLNLILRAKLVAGEPKKSWTKKFK